MMIFSLDTITRQNEFIISNTIVEILNSKKCVLINKDTIEFIAKELDNFMKAMQVKQNVYDYAIGIEYNNIVNKYEGKIAYSLINTEKMSELDKDKYEKLIEFSF